MDWFSDHIAILLVLFWVLYMLGVAFWIILQRRDPSSTLAWIMLLGFLPFVGIVVYYFFGPKKFKRQRNSRRRSRKTISKNANIWGIQDGSHFIEPNYKDISLLIDNTSHTPTTYSWEYKFYTDDDIFEAIFEGVRNSTEYVLVQYYQFDSDTIGTRFRDLLIKKLHQGVKVFLLVDAYGSKSLNRRFLKPFLDAGGQLEFFHNLSFKRLPSLLNFRNHRKIVICDGLYAFTGCTNMTDLEYHAANSEAFHDVHIRLNGPSVMWLESVFAQDWIYSTGNKDLFRILKDSYKRRNNRKLNKVNLSQSNLEEGESGSRFRVQLIQSGPDTKYAPIMRAMMTAIHQARHHIYLITPYFVPDEAAIEGLTSAALRGVKVHILVPEMSDFKWVTLATRSWFDELYKAGVVIHLYKPSMIHTKMLVVDEDISFLGSANFDNRSFYINFEISVLCYEKEANSILTKEFNRCVTNSEIYIPQKYGLWTRFVHSLARLSSPLL
ncbi:cardiolipin synthase [Taylorella equigenitalis]|uniref:cardiolipin synthase n=1 Tax=Taylorella equigenitalis TaxID=29575 RepID=UPI00237CAD43|nr:cardiolipin synthase [Taylorella equigenitalis]WDU55128.1 cardiolipin synthase [Taylorella equigenitalis]